MRLLEVSVDTPKEIEDLEQRIAEAQENKFKAVQAQNFESVAAKDKDKKNTVYEIADLAYHVMVLMIEAGISLEDIHKELASRHVIDKKVKQEKMV